MIDDPATPWRPSITEQQLRLAINNVPRSRWLASVARNECVFETAAAEFFGREFTRIYWYHSDEPNSKPILTMWDMNEPAPARYDPGWTDPRGTYGHAVK